MRRSEIKSTINFSMNWVSTECFFYLQIKTKKMDKLSLLRFHAPFRSRVLKIQSPSRWKPYLKAVKAVPMSIYPKINFKIRKEEGEIVSATTQVSGMTRRISQRTMVKLSWHLSKNPQKRKVLSMSRIWVSHSPISWCRFVESKRRSIPSKAFEKCGAAITWIIKLKNAFEFYHINLCVSTVCSIFSIRR